MDQIIVVSAMIVQLVIGYLIKKSTTAENKIRKVIPLVTLVGSFLTQLSVAATSALPAVVPVAAGTVVMAGIFGTFGKGLFDIVAQTLIQTFFVTGAHSTAKNLKQSR